METNDTIHDMLMDVYQEYAKQNDFEASAQPNFRIEEFIAHVEKFWLPTQSNANTADSGIDQE